MQDKLSALYELSQNIARREFKERLLAFADFFLNVNYGAWKNGSNLLELDDFNYDLTMLDCVTYVEVVLALAKTTPHTSFEKFVTEFENILRHIHYAKGIPNFLNRNHFFCIDWIENNKNITEDVTHALPFTIQIAQTNIDKPTWFARHAINVNNSHAEVLQSLSVQESRVPYIATGDLLDNYQKLITALPQYCIVTVIRPNWDLRSAIGTHLNISHLGFAFKNDVANAIDFYHSTVIDKKVVYLSLDQYMRKHIDSPTIKGFGMLAISPGYYHAR